MTNPFGRHHQHTTGTSLRDRVTVAGPSSSSGRTSRRTVSRPPWVEGYVQNCANDQELYADADAGDELRELAPKGVDQEEHKEDGGYNLHNAVYTARKKRVRRVPNLSRAPVGTKQWFSGE